jgi:hypothetical protein
LGVPAYADMCHSSLIYLPIAADRLSCPNHQQQDRSVVRICRIRRARKPDASRQNAAAAQRSVGLGGEITPTRIDFDSPAAVPQPCWRSRHPRFVVHVIRRFRARSTKPPAPSIYWRSWQVGLKNTSVSCGNHHPKLQCLVTTELAAGTMTRSGRAGNRSLLPRYPPRDNQRIPQNPKPSSEERPRNIPMRHHCRHAKESSPV